MERLGLLHIPPMEPLVAAHLLPRMGPSPSRNPTLPAKTDRFQSTMTERSYKAAALSARALNVSSMLTAYQAELCEDLSSNSGPATLDEIATVTDNCLRVQRCAIQATSKVMGIIVVQERARWLNLTNLPDREKEDVLDMPIVPEGIFGSALASMQRRCESKKKEDEALHLCLPRRVQPLPPQQRPFAQAAPNPAGFKVPGQQRSQPARVPSPGRRRGRVGLENLRFQLQPRRSQPRISASSRGGRSERKFLPRLETCSRCLERCLNAILKSA
ncbi:hypothetical protein CesoFtcFv8_002539 [Champsocephalus esox]|uniref:Uncharacterized protein n=1 Tax=Champsocephalus esox TaxID=159716 RepID=A0AAN8D2X6_9TELE|nr:hypothetical protein CesoFtcFv8_002539 [Champsocephalus esox]